MIYLLFSIFFSSLIFIVFKLFDKYQINTLQAIVVNYVVACSIGLISYSGKIQVSIINQKPWFIGAIVLSILFISVFNVMAKTAQNNGVTVASIAGKMSVIIPIIFGVILYQEKLSTIQISGIVLALIAVYLTTTKGGDLLQKNQFIFPILLFIGSGIIDTSIKYIQLNYVIDSELPYFMGTVFCFACIIGLCILFTQKRTFQSKSIIAGLILGLINYYSIYFLLKALDTKNLLSATVFTVNNVAIVMFTTLLGIILFKEKLNIKNWIGIGVAILSILLIAN